MQNLTASPRVALPVRNVEAPTYVFDASGDACRHVAQQIAGIIRERNSLGRSATLGLVAGSSPIGVYQELVRLHEENGLDFSRVSVFTVNEYYGLDRERLQSHRLWLNENFVKKVNLDPATSPSVAGRPSEFRSRIIPAICCATWRQASPLASKT